MKAVKIIIAAALMFTLVFAMCLPAAATETEAGTETSSSVSEEVSSEPASSDTESSDESSDQSSDESDAESEENYLPSWWNPDWDDQIDAFPHHWNASGENWDNLYNESIKYTFSDGTLTVSGKGMLNFVNMKIISDKISMKKVKKLVIKKGITSIEDYACSGRYFNFSNLKTVVIPSGVKSTGEGTFCRNAALTKVDFPDTLQSIDSWAFEECTSLEVINLPKSVKYIADRAFADCTRLRDFTVNGASVSVDETAFSGCKGISDITVKSTNQVKYFPRKYITSVTLIDGATTIGKSAFSSCSSLEEVTIPDTVTAIKANAFKGCKLIKWLTIPKEVETIADSAFSGCESLTLMVYNKSVAHEYAKKNEIKFKVIDPPDTSSAKPIIGNLTNRGDGDKITPSKAPEKKSEPIEFGDILIWVFAGAAIIAVGVISVIFFVSKKRANAADFYAEEEYEDDGEEREDEEYADDEYEDDGDQYERDQIDANPADFAEPQQAAESDGADANPVEGEQADGEITE